MTKSRQECIPVGCVPLASVATTRRQYQGVYFLEGYLLEGVPSWKVYIPREVYLPDGCTRHNYHLPRMDLGQAYPLPRRNLGPDIPTTSCGQTDTFENITLSQLLLRAVIRDETMILPCLGFPK